MRKSSKRPILGKSVSKWNDVDCEHLSEPPHAFRALVCHSSHRSGTQSPPPHRLAHFAIVKRRDARSAQYPRSILGKHHRPLRRSRHLRDSASPFPAGLANPQLEMQTLVSQAELRRRPNQSAFSVQCTEYALQHDLARKYRRPKSGAQSFGLVPLFVRAESRVDPFRSIRRWKCDQA